MQSPQPLERTGLEPLARHRHHQNSWREPKMRATRSLLAAMVLGTAIGASQAYAQCSGNAGTCNTTNTASVTVGALVKLDMTTTTTALTNPTADDVAAGNTLANDGPQFTIKAN